MKVLLINTYDRGGAANACIRLHNALLEAGHSSHLLTLNKTREDLPFHFDYETFTGHKAGNILNRLNHITIDNSYRYTTREVKDISIEASKYTDVFSSIYSDYRIEDAPSMGDYDVVNLHWTSRFLNWPSFFSSKRIKQVVWSLHDLAPFTGGYHYSDGFEGFKTDDSNPHFLRKTSDPDFSKKLLIAKQKILTDSSISFAVISLSNWLHNCAQQSTLFGKYPIRRIANSVDTNTFRFIDKREARKQLSLEKDKQIVLFISDNISNKRKGFHLLEEALVRANDNNVLLCSVGKNLESNLNSIHDFSTIDDEKTLALIYAAADVFVLPALEDNLPNVVVESLCCGTPVVGFKIGGMTDLVVEGKNGRLATDISAQGLYHAMSDVLRHGVSLTPQEIADSASKTYSYSVQASHYTDYINSLIL